MDTIDVGLTIAVTEACAVGILVAAAAFILCKRTRFVAMISTILGSLALQTTAYYELLEWAQQRLKNSEMSGWAPIEAILMMVYLAPLTLSVSALIYYTTRQLKSATKPRIDA